MRSGIRGLIVCALACVSLATLALEQPGFAQAPGDGPPRNGPPRGPIRMEPDPRVQQLPQAMLEREMRVMARMIRAGQQDGAGAAPDELNTWIEKFASEYPAAIEGLTMMDTPAPGSAQATTICQSNIAMTEALAKEEPATRARLFRALLQS